MAELKEVIINGVSILVPLNRRTYKHISGRIYVVWGCANHMLDKNHTEPKPIVIMADINSGEPEYYPLEKFWDKNPNTQEPRFQLVESSEKK